MKEYFLGVVFKVALVIHNWRRFYQHLGADIIMECWRPGSNLNHTHKNENLEKKSHDPLCLHVY